MNKSLTILILLFVSHFVSAAVIVPDTLCNASKGCYVSAVADIYSSEKVSMFSGTEQGFFPGTNIPATVNTIWASYELGSASRYFDPGDPGTGADPYPPVNKALTGTVFVRTQQFYLFGQSVPSDWRGGVVSVFMLKTNGTYSQLDFDIDADALTGAYGNSYSSGGFGEVEDITEYGNMTPLNLWTCVECGWDIELNLINFMFVDNGTGMLVFQPNIADERELIFRNQTTYYYGYEYTYTLASVPVPAAGWLFLSGVAGLVCLERRTQKS